MNLYTETGDALKADRIVASARKVTKPEVIIFNGRHRAMRVKLIEQATAIIEKELRFLG